MSALGLGKGANLEALRSGRSGVGSVRYLRTELRELPVGEVPIENDPLLSRTSLMGILAVREAMQQAGISGADYLISGTTVGGMDLTEQSWPRYNPSHDCGSITNEIAAATGRFGCVTTLSTACSSAANAIILGANLIRSGKAGIIVAGGTEALSDYHLHGFNSLMILDRNRCTPFTEGRAGLNLGEGAAFLVMESMESALQRGAKPLCELSGYGNACDAFHQTASSENGEGAFLAMQKALAMAELKAEEIDYVNAHGTGTPNNDASESAALRRVFGEKLPPVSSTKPLTGHTTSASGSIEAVFCMLAMQEGFIPLQAPGTDDPACISPARGKGSAPAQLKHVVCNAFGFGGNDSSIILSAL